jgi:deazaflavin-dependent oxidoreductase (nitroreductase family)
VDTPAGFKRLIELLYLFVNYLILISMPTDGVGPFWGKVFKLPVFLYQRRLWWLIPGNILILTTIARKSEKCRQTALEYQYQQDVNVYKITAGWGGKNDWFKNIKANPHVRIWVKAEEFNCRAEIESAEEVRSQLIAFSQRNPFAKNLFSRWIGRPYDGSPESVALIADFMPMVILHPENPSVM